MVVEEEPPAVRRLIKVLIIDDEPDIVDTLSHHFRNAGVFAVEQALDGQAGLEKAKTFRPDVVLLDLVMPKTDGWEVCRRLRGEPETRNLPVVMMTACAGPEIECCAQEEGVREVLFKPFVLRGLVETLLGVLSGGAGESPRFAVLGDAGSPPISSAESSGRRPRR